MIEAGPPGALVRRGWRKDSVLPGIELVVQGYHAIDGTNKANGREVTFPDGRRLFAGSSVTLTANSLTEKKYGESKCP